MSDLRALLADRERRTDALCALFGVTTEAGREGALLLGEAIAGMIGEPPSFVDTEPEKGA